MCLGSVRTASPTLDADRAPPLAMGVMCLEHVKAGRLAPVKAIARLLRTELGCSQALRCGAIATCPSSRASSCLSCRAGSSIATVMRCVLEQPAAVRRILHQCTFRMLAIVQPGLVREHFQHGL